MKKGSFAATVILSLLIIAAGIYTFQKQLNDADKTFAKGMEINGVSVAGMDLEEAKDVLIDDRQSTPLAVVWNGQTMATIENLEIEYDIDDLLKEQMRGNVMRLRVPDFIPGENTGLSHTINMPVASASEKASAYLQSFTFLDQPYSTKTQDAYVDVTDKDFPIVKEVYGDNIDKARFEKAVLKAITRGKTTLEFEPSDYYELPKVKSDDPELPKYQAFCKEYLSSKITLQFYDGDETVPTEKLASMITMGEKGEPVVDETQVANYVAELAYKHDTLGHYVPFKTHAGTTVNVLNYDDGYALDQQTEIAQLTEDLKSGKDVEREPTYSSRSYSGKADVGKNYVEINIPQQHLWLVIDGKDVVSCGIVSGNESRDRGTPSGIYTIKYKERNKTLRDLDYDGSEYEIPVDYWMPFNGGIGLHDAPWRSEAAFGGTYYLTEGSHGCINMPVSVTPTIYKNVEAGFPVVVYR